MAIGRKANELLVNVEVFHELFSIGEARTWRVVRGPTPEARLVGVRWTPEWVVLEYDRPVEEPCLVVEGARRTRSTGGIVQTHMRAKKYVVGEAGPETFGHPGEIKTSWS